MVRGSSLFNSSHSVRYNSAVDGPHRDITYPFTMTGYIYLHSSVSDKYIFSMTKSSGGGTEVSIGVKFNGKTPSILCGDGTGTTSTAMTDLTNYDTWYYVTLIVNSAIDRSWYVDGVYDSNSTVSRDIVAQKANMDLSSVGTYITTGGSSLPFDGLATYIQFYNDALTIGEMSSQMADPSNILDNPLWIPDLTVDSTTIGDYTDLSGSGYTPNAGTAPLYNLRDPVYKYIGAGCVDFNGLSSESYITMGSFSALDAATEASFVMWVNFNALEDAKSFLSQYTAFADANWYFTTSGTKYGVLIKKTTAGTTNYHGIRSQDSLSTLFSVGTWYHMVITWKYNDNTLGDFKMYKNGSSISIETAASNGTLDEIGSSGPDLQIGCLNTDLYNINAKMAHIGIYDKQLSESEVKALYMNPDAIISNRVSYIPCNDWNFRDLETRDTADKVEIGATLRDSGPPIQ